MTITAPEWTVLQLTGMGIVPYSTRAATQSLEPISQAGAGIYRDVNGVLRSVGGTSFQKYRSAISCKDIRPIAIDGVWPGKVLSIDCIQTMAYPTSGGSPARAVVPGSSFTEGSWTFYLVAHLHQCREEEPGPRILVEALKTYGTIEKPGEGSNPSIMAWAKVTGLDRIYRSDATAWCGLWMAYVALQAGWNVPLNPLGARNWLAFGVPQQKSALGDVLIFWRGTSGGFNGHVGLYVGEDAEAFHVLGGNQSDRVMIKRIAKNRLLGCRRCPWRINQPAAVRPVVLAANGALSTNEA